MSLFDLISEPVRSMPDQLAVVSGDRSLTYDQLRSRALRFATLLRAVGVSPGDRVGIFLHKSIDSAAAVYGVLAAGAAYVPVDPGATPAYALGLLEHAEASAVITDAPTALSAASESKHWSMAILDATDADDLDVQEAEPHQSHPDDLAYVMFTSGSTGEPKGMMHTHRSGLAYAERAAEVYSLRSDDRLANIAPLHFDQSTFELFSGPSVGATSYFIPEPYLKLPASLSKLIEDEGITIWYSVPFILNQLVERGALEQRDLASVRWVLFGGEAIGPAAVGHLMTHFHEARFSNVYGPAEVNQCTVRNFNQPPALDRPVPIGQPWGNTEAQISADGELWIRSDTMMSGYWKRPDLTSAAIVDGWYRTGDVVEINSDGEMIFIGRLDNQVKVRGQRVELEAVDAAMNDHPKLAHAITILGTGPGGLPALVALAVAADGADPDPKGVLADVAGHLPPAAVPFRLVLVSDLPRTASGKIDRRAAAGLLDVDPTDRAASR